MARRIGLLTLRAYIIFAIVIMVIKLIQVTTRTTERTAPAADGHNRQPDASPLRTSTGQLRPLKPAGCDQGCNRQHTTAPV
ncbi:MAG TPA: hypothetical protein VN969_05380 [Streptosporangiaceae bacterium]|jgi:hypothetical protein|nr:hypothetical protein [Streptosporangiaceae bacterium]